MDNHAQDDMRLGPFEFYAMNNPVKRFVHKHFEMVLFRNFLREEQIDLTQKRILDAGCGSGYSTELIQEEFSPSLLSAFDIMPEQIKLARKRSVQANFYVGDLTNINEADSSFDAVFVFGVIHHIPEWRKALAEMYRVLEPNGVLLIEEPRVRFTWDEFEDGVQEAGFRIISEKSFLFGFFKSYLCKRDSVLGLGS